ncbi:MAG TPA: thiamine pyrophosphate-dependent dehydrogenase E1 component subunit alpha [Bacteroidia bacterium]|nr:thiamine pyrophosphate-dependent dehydrogenase E1 component subunit alpha [Bacteroidia bacterium]
MSASAFHTASSHSRVTADEFVAAYRGMLVARLFEEKISALYRGGKIVGGVYVGRGQEAFSYALGGQLDRRLGDVFAGLIRDQAGRTAFGEPLIDAARTYLGKASGPMRGRDGNIHRGRPADGMPAMISHLGASVSVVNGMLIAKRFRDETGFVGGVTAGDGATSTGAFHEGLNQAAVERLPLVVAVADNQFAYSTPTSRQYACEDLADRAVGYGVTGYSIDGTDLMSCLETFRTAISRARAGEGPQMVVGRLLRLSGHGEHDDASYVPDEARAGRYGRDCLALARERILAESFLDTGELDRLESEVQSFVEDTFAQAQSEEPPNPIQEDWRALATTRLSEGTF